MPPMPPPMPPCAADLVQTFCTSSRRPCGPLTPPTGARSCLPRPVGPSTQSARRLACRADTTGRRDGLVDGDGIGEVRRPTDAAWATRRAAGAWPQGVSLPSSAGCGGVQCARVALTIKGAGASQATAASGRP
jgi:hypothetical protein